MPAQTYFGLNNWVGSDVASTALTDTTNTRLLDAAAGHVWNVATGTNTETVWVTVNAVSPTATTATMKVATPAAALSLNAAGLLQLFVTPTGTTGGAITWGPAVFSVSPTGIGTAVVSASTWNIAAVSATSFVVNTLLVTPTVSATSAYVQLGQPNPLVTATSGFMYLASMVSTPTATPTTYSGMSPMVVDITTPALWVAPNTGTGAAWRQIAAPPRLSAFTAATGTYTTPAAAKAIWVRLVGGGGGGGGGSNNGVAGGGSAGGYSEIVIAGPLAATYSVVIGAAGSAGAAGGDGGAGGTSAFGGVVTCTGGGAGMANGNVGAGGTGTGGTLNLTGGTGGIGVVGTGYSVSGGSSVFGGAGLGNASGGGAAATANTGSGGSGAAQIGNAGGAGAAGLCLVMAYF